MSTIKPIFRMFDYAKAVEFYIDWLGFKIDWEDKPENAPIYLQISRGDIALHLSEHYGDGSPGAKAYIETAELRKYHAELNAKNYKYYRPSVEQAPWNALCMEVIDPFGNRLLFAENQPT